MAVVKCNFFFRAVDDRPIVESVMPDLKYEVEDTKRKIMASHYQDIVEKLKEEQQEVVEKVDRYDWETRSVVDEENVFKHPEIQEKRGRGRPRKT